MDEDADKNAESVKFYEGIINKIIEILCVCVSFNVICILHISLCVPEKVATSHRISEQTNK